jgi:hypothetical protein
MCLLAASGSGFKGAGFAVHDALFIFCALLNPKSRIQYPKLGRSEIPNPKSKESQIPNVKIPQFSVTLDISFQLLIQISIISKIYKPTTIAPKPEEN